MSFSNEEKQKLSELKIQKLYTRFCDINLNGGNQAVPVAKIELNASTIPSSIEIVPVVFISNKVFEHDITSSLAENVISLIGKTAAISKLSFSELQIDCDWTPGTKEKYFSFLEAIKQKLGDKILSATIRLHQVKYFRRTGIPPVDRGMLMFYNMGNIQDSSLNSIFNVQDAGKYTSSIKAYRLKLDVALPIFGWVKHYRDGKVIGLINDLSEDDLKKESFLSATTSHHYRSLNDMFYHGEYLEEGDLLVPEEVKPELTKKAAEVLRDKLNANSFSVVLYHWDNICLSKYENKNIEDVYHCFD